eukprot:1156350-Pelagomonas_calceolata.AAC.14
MIATTEGCFASTAGGASPDTCTNAGVCAVVMCAVCTHDRGLCGCQCWRWCRDGCMHTGAEMYVVASAGGGVAALFQPAHIASYQHAQPGTSIYCLSQAIFKLDNRSGTRVGRLPVVGNVPD